MANRDAFKERFNRWKQGLPVYKAGKVICYDEGKDEEDSYSVEDANEQASLQYLSSLVLDNRFSSFLNRYDEGKDVAGSHNFNAIPRISQNAGISYQNMYDPLTGDLFIDSRQQQVPMFKKGKNGFDQQTGARLKQLYGTLRNAGYDHNSAIGILANSMQESSLDADSVSKTKNYFGMFQNNKDIKNAIEGLYGDHSEKNQLQYLYDWTSGNSRVKKGKYAKYLATNSGKYKKSGYNTPEDAATAFMKLYERPVILDKQGNVVGYQQHNERVNYATKINGYLGGITVPYKAQPQQVPVQKFTEVEEYPVQIPNIPTREFKPNSKVPQAISSWSSPDAPSVGRVPYEKFEIRPTRVVPSIVDSYNNMIANETLFKPWIVQ